MNTYSAPHRARSPEPVTRTSSATGKNAAEAATIAYARYRESPAPMRMPSSTKTMAVSGCIERDGPEHAEQLVAHRRVVGEHDTEDRLRREHEERGADARDDAPLEHALAAAPCRFRIARAEVPADDRLRGDRDRVQREREEVPELPRDLMRGDLDVADPRRDRRGGDEHREQRRGAHRQVTADHGRGAYVRAIQARRRVRAPHVAADDHRGTRLPRRPARSPCPTPSRRRPSGSRTRTGPRGRG